MPPYKDPRGGRHERFSLEHKPPPNYKSVLSLRNREQAEKDRSAPKEKLPEHKAVCGMNCAECEYYTGTLGDGEMNGCPGCNIGGNDCDIRICCLVKSFKSCYECETFPCDKLKLSDAESSDSDLAKFKSEMDSRTDRGVRKRNRVICGALAGLLVGLLADMAMGTTVIWVLAGTIVGTAIPLIIHSGE